MYHLIPNEREISSVDMYTWMFFVWSPPPHVTPSVSAAQFTPLASLPSLARWLRDISSVTSEPVL